MIYVRGTRSHIEEVAYKARVADVGQDAQGDGERRDEAFFAVEDLNVDVCTHYEKALVRRMEGGRRFAPSTSPKRSLAMISPLALQWRLGIWPNSPRKSPLDEASSTPPKATSSPQNLRLALAYDHATRRGVGVVLRNRSFSGRRVESFHLPKRVPNYRKECPLSGRSRATKAFLRLNLRRKRRFSGAVEDPACDRGHYGARFVNRQRNHYTALLLPKSYSRIECSFNH